MMSLTLRSGEVIDLKVISLLTGATTLTTALIVTGAGSITPFGRVRSLMTPPGFFFLRQALPMCGPLRRETTRSSAPVSKYGDSLTTGMVMDLE
jgi:hypothetical protein